tara:strand:+ start:2156 stop:2443 length:288 start_codon:yes stop_codon:yes gene_type:complete
VKKAILFLFVIFGMPFVNYALATYMDFPLAQQGTDMVSKWGVGFILTGMELIAVVTPSFIPYFGGLYYNWLARLLGFRDTNSEDTHKAFWDLFNK